MNRWFWIYVLVLPMGWWRSCWSQNVQLDDRWCCRLGFFGFHIFEGQWLSLDLVWLIFLGWCFYSRRWRNCWHRFWRMLFWFLGRMSWRRRIIRLMNWYRSHRRNRLFGCDKIGCCHLVRDQNLSRIIWSILGIFQLKVVCCENLRCCGCLNLNYWFQL